MSSLKQRALSGVLWSSIQKFGIEFLLLISNIILARLLSPKDYGCIGLLMIFISIANTLIDGGFGSALIQKKHPTSNDYSTVFYINILVSLILYIILFAFAPLVESFYRVPELKNILRVQGVVLIINAFSIIQNNKLRKELKIKKLAKIQLFSTLISTFITIILAYMGAGVWSLVFQQLLIACISSIVLWISTDFRPSFSLISNDSFKQLFSFSSFMMLSSLIETFYNNIHSLIIGKLFTVDLLGYFTQARKLVNAITNSLISILSNVSFPIFAEVQDETTKSVAVLRKFNIISAYIIVPVLLLLILLAEPLIVLIFSEKWLPSVSFFKILCVQGIGLCLQGNNYNAIASKGLSKVLFKWTLIKRIITLILIFIGVLFGIYGLLWGMTAGTYIILIINSYLVHTYVGYDIKKQMKDYLPIILISTSAFIGGYIFSHTISMQNISYIVCIITFITIYILLSALCRLESFCFIFEILKKNIRRYV